MNWLIKKLVDNGWGRFGLAFSWVLGAKKVFNALLSDNNLNTTEHYYKLIEKNGFFAGEKGVKNQQAFIHTLFSYEKFKVSLASRMFDADSPNSSLKSFLDFIRRAFFHGASSKANKKAFVQAVFTSDTCGSALNDVVSKPKKLQIILDILSEAECFANEESAQYFIDAITTNNYDQLPLRSAASSADSLTLIYNQLKEIGCFNSANNKQKIINAIFARNEFGNSAILNASRCKKSITIILDMLTEAGCFDGPIGTANKQAFVTSVVTANQYGLNCLMQALNNDKILNKLKEIEYFKGPFGENNKQAFIDAVLTPASLTNESALQRQCDFPLITEFFNHLRDADCISIDSTHANKRAFIKAILTVNHAGNNVLSHIRLDNLTLLMNIFSEMGCAFDIQGSFFDKELVRQFFMSFYSRIMIISNDHDLNSYLASYKNLILNGLSAVDIKTLLNTPIRAMSHDAWNNIGVTPLMMALRNKDDALAARLIADGAELTDQQKQQVQSYFNQQPIIDSNKLKQQKSVSLCDLSLFKPKQVQTKSIYSMDDLDIGKLVL